MLRFLDAGESHGRGMVTIVEGLPHGLSLRAERVESELARRRLGHGRGARMRLEADRVEILSGVRAGKTLGSPLSLLVRNVEYEKWQDIMSVEGEKTIAPMTAPRPGHADLAGAMKYGTHDLRDVLERASARETVARVCVGAVCKALLGEVGITVCSHVLEVGGEKAEAGGVFPTLEEVMRADDDEMRCLDRGASRRMVRAVDAAREEGDSLGGVFEVVAFGLPAGLGSHAHWDRRLDARLAAAVMSIQAVKGVEIGDGFEAARKRGSQAFDVIEHEPARGFYRLSNHAGGIEGGMSNGEPLVLRAAMKPIPTTARPRDTVDIVSKEKVKATVERADVCAVPAAAIVAESSVAFVLAQALIEKTGGDSMYEIRERFGELETRQAGF
ncbi:MAG: chorismate synthase [Actinomycetota bacterium]|nr:chorismate synthase [Actinomycetota bacterium]MDD5666046.1 chorismate synthase [Actinomycetota bacterium]